MITAGVDIGSVAAKSVVFDHAEQAVLGFAAVPTGCNHKEAFEFALSSALRQAGMEKSTLAAVTATGYGRMSAKERAGIVSEIRCHARGARFLFPEADGVIDIGGQDSKAIRLSVCGGVADFVMNDKCAAGTGRFLQMAATLLEMDLESFSAAAAQGEPAAVNSMCAVFAESEIISLLAGNVPLQNIAAGVVQSVVQRTATLAGRLGISGATVFSGGLAVSASVTTMLGRALGSELLVPDSPQLTGALGAALLAGEEGIFSTRASQSTA